MQAGGFITRTEHYRTSAAFGILKPSFESGEFLLFKVYICADQTKELSLKAGIGFTKSRMHIINIYSRRLSVPGRGEGIAGDKSRELV